MTPEASKRGTSRGISTMKCQECGCRCKLLVDDPRDPPLDEDPCLCEGCHRTAVEEVIEELQTRILWLKGSIGLK